MGRHLFFAGRPSPFECVDYMGKEWPGVDASVAFSVLDSTVNSEYDRSRKGTIGLNDAEAAA
jgi:hypothetical protein